MRSRYSAYALDLDAYVLETWAPETRPAVLFEDGEERPKWLSLVIHSSYEEGAEGRVSFTAAGRTSLQGACGTADGRFDESKISTYEPPFRASCLRNRLSHLSIPGLALHRGADAGRWTGRHCRYFLPGCSHERELASTPRW